jgi:exonuclease VII small subunit
VQYTGASRFPDSGGLFRFRNMQEAEQSLEKVVTDYERQCRLARALAEEHFDARKVVGRVLERALA